MRCEDYPGCDWFGEPISAYTRAQALEDGVLADVSEWGREYGFRVPVAMTATLWRLVDIDHHQDTGNQRAWIEAGESTRGRAHDVLWLACLALKGALKRGDYLAMFRVTIGPETLTLRAEIDGDGVTLGLPEDF